MNATQHVGELAELYALGTLEPSERTMVDAHVRACPECAARLGEAEAIVTGLVTPATPRAALDRRARATFASRSAWRSIAPPIAAAFVLGLIVPSAWWFGSSRNDFDTNQQAGVRAMVNGHFLHAQFVPVTADAPKAKILYGRTAPWRLIVAQTTRSYAVAAQRGRAQVVLGRLYVSGDVAELFVPVAPAHSGFVLMDGSRVVARVTLPYRR